MLVFVTISLYCIDLAFILAWCDISTHIRDDASWTNKKMHECLHRSDMLETSKVEWHQTLPQVPRCPSELLNWIENNVTISWYTCEILMPFKEFERYYHKINNALLEGLFSDMSFNKPQPSINTINTIWLNQVLHILIVVKTHKQLL